MHCFQFSDEDNENEKTLQGIYHIHDSNILKQYKRHSVCVFCYTVVDQTKNYINVVDTKIDILQNYTSTIPMDFRSVQFERRVHPIILDQY